MTTRREYHYYYHGKSTGPAAPTPPTSLWSLLPLGAALVGTLWVVAMVPVFGVGMLGAWIEGDRLPLEGGVHTVIHTNKEVGKFTYVFTSVAADNIINGESTYTKGW